MVKYVFIMKGVLQSVRTRKKPCGNANMIGVRVEQLRKINNMKQKELLRLLLEKGIEINASALSKLKGETRQVNDFEIVALAEVFGVPVAMLLGVEQNNHNHA